MYIVLIKTTIFCQSETIQVKLFDDIKDAEDFCREISWVDDDYCVDAQIIEEGYDPYL